MTIQICPSFDKFPFEHIQIGKLITGYGDIELGLFNTINVLSPADQNVLKSMYGERGEKKRICKALELGIEIFKSYNMEQEFIYLIGNIDWCRLIRNMYAHGNYWNAGLKTLVFTEIEKLTENNTDPAEIKDAEIYPITKELILKQIDFFNYTYTYCLWANFEIRHRKGDVKKDLVKKPITIEKPPLKADRIYL